MDTGGKFSTSINNTSEKGGKTCHWCRWYWWSTLTCEDLREFSKKIETVFWDILGLVGNWFMKKTSSKKSRDTVPLNMGSALCNWLASTTIIEETPRRLRRLENRVVTKGRSTVTPPTPTAFLRQASRQISVNDVGNGFPLPLWLLHYTLQNAHYSGLKSYTVHFYLYIYCSLQTRPFSATYLLARHSL